MFKNPSWKLISSERELLDELPVLAAGEGPFAVDVERASGYKYFPRAYLIQIYRRGSSALLIDPVEVPELSHLYEVMQDHEWILHAAGADLPSLRELNLAPKKLFDTELASRLLGFERVGLGSMTENVLGVELEKAFSRADWSTRPLPEEWLEYAALDVLVLPDLRDKIKGLLEESQKIDFAEEEFQALIDAPEKPENEEPWRRLSGFGKIKDRRLQEIAKELWLARDRLGRELDITPARLISDRALLVAVTSNPRSPGDLAKNKDFNGTYSRKALDAWWRAIVKARKTDLPKKRPSVLSQNLAPKSIRLWERKNPEAYERLVKTRELLDAEAERLQIPRENLLSPALIRELCWDPPPNISSEGLGERLRNLGARQWQTELTSHLIEQSFVEGI